MTTTARGKGASGRLATKAFLCLLVALFARQGYGQQTVVSDPLQALPSAVTDVQSAVNKLTNQSVVDPSLVPDQLIPSQLQQQNNGIPQQTNNPVPGVDNPQPAQGVGNPKPTDAFSNPQNIQGGGNPQTIQGGGNPLPIQGNGNAQPVQSGGNTQPTQSGGSPQIQNFVDPNKTPMNNFVSPGQQQGYNNNVNSQPEYSDPNQGVNNLSNNRPQQQIPQKTIMVTMIPPAQMHDPSLHFPVYNSPMLPQTFNQVPQFNGYQKPHASQNQMKYPTVGNGYPVYSSPNSGGGAQNWMSQFPGIPQLPGMPQIPGMPLLPGMSNGFGLPIESLMTAFNPMPYAQQPMGMATNTVDKMRDYTTGVRQGVGRVVYDVGNKILDGSQSLVHGMLDAAAVIPDKVFEMKRNGLNAFAGLLDVRPPTGINGNHYQHMSNGNYLYHHPTSAQVQQNPQHSEYQQQPQYSEYQQQQSQQQQPQQQQPQQQQFQQQQPQQQQLQQQQPQQQSQQQPVKNENSILDTPNPINEPQPIVRYGSVRNYQPARFIY